MGARRAAGRVAARLGLVLLALGLLAVLPGRSSAQGPTVTPTDMLLPTATATPQPASTVTAVPTATVAPTPTVLVIQNVQLAFPPFSDAGAGERGNSVLYGLTMLFCMLLIHAMYGMFAGYELSQLVRRVEDLGILSIFAAIELVLLFMPDRWDLQVATFTLWLFLFVVRSLIRELASAIQ